VPSTERRELLAILVGGGLGGGIRTGLSELAPTHPGHWPWVTFGVNLIDCFLVGYFVTRLQERLPITAYRRPLLGTGVCGGLTTFSTFQLELLQMLGSGTRISGARLRQPTESSQLSCVEVSENEASPDRPGSCSCSSVRSSTMTSAVPPT
jgi:fluoride exporter